MKSHGIIAIKYALHQKVFEGWKQVIEDALYESEEQLRQAEQEMKENYQAMVILGWVLDFEGD